MKYSLDGQAVQFAGRHYIAPGAHVIGNVRLGDEVSVWFNAVIRADNDIIEIGAGTNIQDGAVLHVDPGKPMWLGRRVTVGHKAMLHGCHIDDGSLIGINAVVLNDARIGKQCLIGANALIKEGMEIPDRSLVVGSPARIVRTLDDAALAMMDAGAQSYIDKIARYSDGLVAEG